MDKRIVVPEFDPATHTYKVNGVVLPGVTTVCKSLHPGQHDGIPPAVLNRKRDIGIAVHKACELYDSDMLQDLGPDADVIGPYFAAWMLFRKENLCTWRCMEQPLAHSVHGYAGMQDRSGLVALGSASPLNAVLDIKTTVDISPLVGVQLGGYELLEPDVEFDLRIAVQLLKNGKYKVHVFPRETTTFLCALGIWKWQQRTNLKGRK